MNKNKKKKQCKIKLTTLFPTIIFVIMVLTAILTFIIIQAIIYLEIENSNYPFLPYLVSECISIMAGTIATIFVSRQLLQPLHSIIAATEKITEGDYSTRLHFDNIHEFEQLGEKFNCMAEELSGIEMLRDDFTNNFSHEFNTPINSIHGFAKLLQQGNLSSEEQQDYLERIVSGSDRLSNLANNVLNLTKIEQQTILTHKKEINITEQIRCVIVMLSMRWEKKEINFDFDCGEYYLIGNEEFLEHLWLNLLDNAIKYSPFQSTIDIKIKENDNELTVVFQDHGKGITTDALPHIFDKFYRSKSSQAVPGTGLGLTIAHKVVTLHGGTISVNSAPGIGATFTIVFPKSK